MKKLALYGLALGFIACQAACQTEKKDAGQTDSATFTAIDTLTYTYDSVRVYPKQPVSKNPAVTDTAKAVISYPVFKDSSLSSFVLKKVLATADEGRSYSSYQTYAEGFTKEFEDFSTQQKDYQQTWFLDISTKVLRQEKGYIALQTRFVSYMGGAHPNSVFSYLNYDPVNKQEILLDSLILPGSMDKLNSIAEGIFRKNEKLAPGSNLKEGYFFENDKFSLNRNFTITEKGLQFLYNPYEIKAYVYGTTTLLIPFSELKGIARPNSLISR
ncbi:DUF3298 and DUF4163 domain-containing protein [Pedobacter sp. GR22-6]|uniref:DUF3298 and DUF4163 domain-containing protein n=1 Tax=Pedobacter sp. GR22-6 TaxID=3127957 RepID=UPI00307D6BEE